MMKEVSFGNIIENIENDSRQRCSWVTQDPLYIHYHDNEWGVPLHDDIRLFEMLILEGMQAGLSWLTILRKREHYRHVLDGFKPEKIANYDQHKINSLLADPGIIRNRRKIEAIVVNAQQFLKICEQFGCFDRYLWNFVEGQPIQNHWQHLSQVPTATPLSHQLARELKQRGFKFVGATICYAYMQAIGMVNDHLQNCFRAVTW